MMSPKSASIVAALLALPCAVPAQDAVLEEIVVTATRIDTSPVSIPIKVEVFDEREIRLQQTLATNPSEIVSNLVPSFSPSRQKMTGAGESFRGRRPLFLIDGVPQSNPLRDGRRDGVTIDMEMVERVEVVFGANAIQGLGATGGIINYVTATPPDTGELEQRVSVGMTGDDELDGDGVGWRAHYSAGQKIGEFDFIGSVSVETRGLQYDGDGRAIALDSVQGDVADSRSRDLFVKLGWEPDEDQRVQLMLNDFELEQNGDFVSVPGDRSIGLPAISVEGDPEGIEPINDVTTASLNYTHTAVAGGTLSAQAYYQDFSALYGGGRFDTFQDPAIAPVGTLFDQSENNSNKVGTRFTYARPEIAGTRLDLIAGLDFVRDETFQRLAQTDRNWVPTTRFNNFAPFVQLDYAATDWLSLSGGVRQEYAELDVPSFVTLAANSPTLQPVAVRGGSPDFDELLSNVGFVITPVDGLRFYGTYSEAFTMPDVGRVLRGVSEPGTAVADFLTLSPVVTDNREIGVAFEKAPGEVRLSYFESESDFGSRLVPNVDGIYEVRREATKIDGWELSGTYRPVEWLAIGAAYSNLDGSFDADEDGVPDSDLSAADIGPDRLNLTLDVSPSGRFSGRVQVFRYEDKAFRDLAGAETARFDGYTTVDASVAAALERVTLTLSVANLLDEQYISYYGQAATTLDDRYFAGRGRTVALRASTRF
ncbi:MAG: TonB-dependent receptor [Gammaproteobacteria bacterium]|nr:TonB-dependent receptor [Gammaproteobacteria bacterium]